MEKFKFILLLSFCFILEINETISQNNKAWSIITSYDIPSGASGLAFDGTYIYCGIYGSGGNEIYQIDPLDGTYTLLYTGTQEDAYGLTYDGNYLWTTDHPGSSSIPAIAIQLNTDGSQLSSFNLPDHYMSGIAYDEGDFWVSSYYDPDGHIYKVDDEGTVLKSFAAPDNQPWDLCLVNGDIWMADYWGDMLYQIDTLTGTLINSYPSEGVDPSGIMFDGTFLWYCDEGSGSFDKLYKIDLTGTGTAQIYLSQNAYDFGPVVIGSTETQNLTIENTGTADLNISGITVPPESNISVPGSFPQTIAPSESIQIEINYNPAAYTSLNTVINIESDDPINPSVEVFLTGHGVFDGASIYSEQTNLDYGDVRSNAFTGRYIYFENSGDESLIIDQITSSSNEFIIDMTINLPLNINVLQKDSIRVWFNPGTEDNYTGVITFISPNAINNQITIDVSGSSNTNPFPIGDELWDYSLNESYDNSPKAIISISDVSEDGIDDLIICSDDGSFRCFNGNSSGTADILWVNESNGSLYQQNALQIIEDINNDGYEDVIVGTAYGDMSVVAISGKTGINIWKYDTHIFGDGGWIYQVDCKYDYNNDGITDVLAASGDDADGTGPKRIHCLDGTDGSVIWDYLSVGPCFSVTGIADCNGDDFPDVIGGTSNSDETQGSGIALNGIDGSVLWQYPINGSSVWALEEIQDLNNDDLSEVIIGSFNLTGNGYFYILDGSNGYEIQTGTITGASIILRFETFEDINNDGIKEILAAHSGPDVVLLDPVTADNVWSFPVGSPDKPWNVNGIPDLNSDGVKDVVAGCLYTNNYIYFIDGVDGTMLHSIPFNEAIDAIGVLNDIAGDNSWELIAGGRDGTIKCFSGGLNASSSVNHAELSNLKLAAYPNPFSNYSVLKIEVEKSSHINIRVKNILGQEVDRIYDGFLPTGIHYIKWYPEGITSGIYFYYISSNDQSQSKKIVFRK